MTINKSKSGSVLFVAVEQYVNAFHTVPAMYLLVEHAMDTWLKLPFRYKSECSQRVEDTNADLQAKIAMTRCIRDTRLVEPVDGVRRKNDKHRDVALLAPFDYVH